MRERNESFVARLYRLLNRPRRGKSLHFRHGAWRYSAAWNLTRGLLESHLRDEHCIALGTCAAGRALFLAIDVDRRFDERFAVFRDVLERRGWARAAFGVSGSDNGRGKVVVTLAKPIPQGYARTLVTELLTDAVADARFGPYSMDISTYPTGGDGSFVRLFGRNRARRLSGLVEAPLDLDGMLDDLLRVEPLDAPARDFPTIRTRGRLSCWAQGILSAPFTGNAADLFRVEVRLADEALRLHGSAAAGVLAEWCAVIAANTLGATASVRRQLERPDAVARAIRYVSTAGRERSSPRPGWVPHHISGFNMVGKFKKSAIRAYQALAEIVRDHNLDPHAFCADYGRIATYGTFADKSDAHAAVRAAEDARLLVRLDRGDARRGGLTTMFALVGAGEGLDDVLDSAVRTQAYQERRRVREAQVAA